VGFFYAYEEGVKTVDGIAWSGPVGFERKITALIFLKAIASKVLLRRAKDFLRPLFTQRHDGIQ
jgi:hypothetical protein